jgi:hypothetical protein
VVALRALLAHCLFVKKNMREGICLEFSLRFLEKVGPGEEVLVLAYNPKN